MFFAGLLGATTDNIIQHYALWTYPTNHPLIPLIGDDWGIYIVVTYLFIQWLPERQTYCWLSLYILVFATIGITIEWIHVVTHHMTHEKWWNYGWSYLANFFLYMIFYYFHKVFQLEKLSIQGK
ncbi:hypothetical protein PP175_22350 [Aneurinibacillus sp. Ricciae_BoGa-3]|uniref:CBO0543 family protein n=1 Tax=Aneurinibacillus sp. Ricciae_BoGa-3 TaxID=3022697 RepID=UPI0023418671|nr:CBO0543 family protein [Aneurinibacillus sp. Ricciae_BoGa-3]WCK54027.1 hypothetical protein PP175_22350 [Aneurinibacillus sp. Ricciae_BoGa-3]